MLKLLKIISFTFLMFNSITLCAHKTVLVTGGGSGIGREIAKAFKEDGWNVFVTTRQSNVEDPQGKVLPIDLTNDKDIEQVVATVYEHTGRIDVLINNAGYGLLGALEDTTKVQVCDQFEVNVFAPLKLSQAVIPHMRTQGGGHIINVSSTSGMRAVPGLGAYAASKMALEGMSEAMSAELAPWNIQVALLEPGTVRNQWAEHVKLPEKFIHPKYENLAKNLQSTLVTKAFTGQSESEIGLLALNIAKTPKPKLRYQTNNQALEVAQKIWSDPSGEVMQKSMQEFAQKLYG